MTAQVVGSLFRDAQITAAPVALLKIKKRPHFQQDC